MPLPHTDGRRRSFPHTLSPIAPIRPPTLEIRPPGSSEPHTRPPSPCPCMSARRREAPRRRPPVASRSSLGTR
eukprot:6209903-Pleurochrysis_carterae.AAC.2